MNRNAGEIVLVSLLTVEQSMSRDGSTTDGIRLSMPAGSIHFNLQETKVPYQLLTHAVSA